MPENLAPEMEERIRELCSKISVAHNLDEDIRRELYSHMEDKLLGYLSGAEKVTKEDAFILVREHFGKTSVIQNLLLETHAMEARTSFLRRLGAITAASLASAGIGAFLLLLIGIVSKNGIYGIITQYSIAWVHLLLPVFLLVGMLLYWRRKMSNGRQPWFYVVNIYYFIGIIISLAFMLVFIRLCFVNIAFSPMERLEWISVLQHVSNDFWPMIIPIFLQSILWLWWIESTSHKFKEMLIGALAWVGYYDINYLFGGVFNMRNTSPLQIIVTGACIFVLVACIAMGVYIFLSRLYTLRNKVIGTIVR